MGNNILDSPSGESDNGRDRPDDLDGLVRKIFDIIPSYYDEREASEIKRLIGEFIDREYIVRK